ncbi:hypothetical protein [Streptomyces sp. NPDC055886]
MYNSSECIKWGVTLIAGAFLWAYTIADDGFAILLFIAGMALGLWGLSISGADSGGSSGRSSDGGAGYDSRGGDDGFGEDGDGSGE